MYKPAVGDDPMVSDVNQYHDVLKGNAHGGTLTFASPVDAPSSAGVATAETGSGLEIGVYVYSMTYVVGAAKSDGTYSVEGETTESTTWNETTISGDQQIAHASLPVPAEATVIAKRLYRTTVGGAQRKLVTTLAKGATTYVDTTPDASLGDDVPTSNTTGTKLSLATPTESTDPATKGYVDGKFIEVGDDDQDVELVTALLQPIDERSIEYAYTSGDITTITIKDGVTTVKTIAIAYNVDGSVDTVTEVVGATTIETTYAYNGDGTVSGETRVVT